MKKPKYTYAPGAQVLINGQEQPLSRQQVMDTILTLNLPLRHLKAIANAFGGYLEVNLVPREQQV